MPHMVLKGLLPTALQANYHFYREECVPGSADAARRRGGGGEKDREEGCEEKQTVMRGYPIVEDLTPHILYVPLVRHEAFGDERAVHATARKHFLDGSQV